MSDSLPTKLAEFTSKGYVIAPAGYGKTHLIARAVNEAQQCQLILTHTFAGVNSIQNKMKAERVTSFKYQIDTIASWALRLCLAYPGNSGWTVEAPEGNQWGQLYESCCKLLEKNFIRHIISSTYSGMYVDEYQDCSQLQHSLICLLADFLPCRILGDPMQAIFDFADTPVDWESSIYPFFDCLGQLETPWRWNNVGANGLGEWLKEVRETLQNGEQIDLSQTLPGSVKRIEVDLNDFKNPRRHSVFYDFLKDSNASVIAIQAGDQQSKYKGHLLARNLAGKFSSIEEVECKEMFSFLKKYDLTELASERFQLVLNFAKNCFTKVDRTLTAGTKRGEISKRTKKTKYPEILEVANSYLRYPTSEHLKAFLVLLKSNSETNLYRRDLFNRFMNVLDMHINSDHPTLLESANIYQRDFRYSGRPLRYNKQIATTLLVKGLEYDHAVILGVDSLNAKELYVAMTRGSKSLTIISNHNTLPVQKA